MPMHSIMPEQWNEDCTAGLSAKASVLLHHCFLPFSARYSYSSDSSDTTFNLTIPYSYCLLYSPRASRCMAGIGWKLYIPQPWFMLSPLLRGFPA